MKLAGSAARLSGKIT